MWNQLKRVFTKLTKGSSRADDAALHKLFHATGGACWTRLDGWPQRDGLGGRFGVITNSDGRIVSLDLRSNNLSGELPEELGNLQLLQELYLADNQLKGDIPTELGDLQAAKIISLSSNALTGEIPRDLGMLPGLESLLLCDNRLTGGIPKQLGDLESVKMIDISRNQLTGEIPRKLCDLPFLEVLYLQGNQLSGGIPKALGKLRCIKKLDLSNNLLSGTIPAALGHLRATQGLFLHENQFHGKIPKEIGYLQSLVTANLSGNKLTGEIPKELGNLAKLEVLYLHDNKLSGGIPAEFGKLRAMKRLRLWRNYLKGQIPKSLGDLQEVVLLDLSSNQLTGEIPEKLGNLAKLDQLYLDDNDLTGGIPKRIGDLQAVKIINLSGNALSGEIPQELGHLPRLRKLYLQGNTLTGPIPKALGNLGHLTHLNVMNNDITGPLPDKLRKHKNFPNFKTGLPLDGGPPLPDISSKGSKRILLLPVVLGYLDLVTDLYTAGTYYSDGHNYWFALVLLFAIAPTFIVAAFFLPHESRWSKIRVVTHTCLVYEAYVSTVMASYSPTLALLRVVEPLFESLPQAFLQLYAMLLVWDETSSSRGNLLSRFLSVSFSIICLAYAATDLCSAESLATFEGNPMHGDSTGSCTQRLTGFCSKIIPECLTKCLTFMSSFVAPSRNMKGGKIDLAGVGRITKDSYVALCFVYHVAEIVSRFVSLALVAVAIHERIFLLLAMFFAIRCIILRWVSTLSSPCLQPPVGSQRDRETRRCSTSPRRLLEIIYGVAVSLSDISLRVKVRLVATPFLDSILEGERAFKVRLGVTLVEFIACLVASAQLQHASDALPSTVRLTFAYVAVGAMAAKMVLAWWLILPLKAGTRPAAVAEQGTAASSHEQAVVTRATVGEQPASNIVSDRARLNRAAFGDWSVETIGGEAAGMSHAAFHEQLIAIISSEEAGTGQATVAKQPSTIYSNVEAMEIGQPSGVQRKQTGSKTNWEEKDNDSMEA